MISIPMAKPMKTPIRLDRMKPLKIRLASTDHVGSTPGDDAEQRAEHGQDEGQHHAPTAASAMPAMNLATTTRDRFGSRVKVTSPLRWLASLVTSMMMMIGRK